MTSKEFVLWLKGFTDGVHEFNITPKQWDILKDKLAEVDDNTIPMGGVIVDHNTFRVPNTAPIQTLPFIQPYNPYNPYQINCGSGSSGTIATTPNVGGSITIANPPFGFGVTSTAYGYPSGSTMSYTNGGKEKEKGE
jgi:hypothetical protein